jgi:hypothetical protein
MAVTNLIWRAVLAGPDSAVAGIPFRRTSVRRERYLYAIAIVTGLVAPWLVHLVPTGGVPLGARLLPIFCGPLVAVLALRLGPATMIALGAPIVSALLTGLPPRLALPGLVIQAVLFVVLLHLLRRWRVAPRVAASYSGSLGLAALISDVLPQPPPIDISGTLALAWPGVLLLVGIGLAANPVDR